MPRKRTGAAHDHAKARAAKEKKLLIVLAIVLPMALFYAYHTMSKLNSSAAPSAASTPANATPVVAVSDTSTTPATAAVLPSVPANSGQLGSFRDLGRVDPFFDGGPQTSTTAGTTQQSPPSGKSAKQKQNAKKAKQQKGQQTRVAVPPPTSAVIAVNGKPTAVLVGTDFAQAPGFANEHLFRLDSLTAKTATIGVVGSRQTFTLKVGKQLALTLSLGPGATWKYTLLLYSGAQAAALQPTATTPTTTTPGG